MEPTSSEDDAVARLLDQSPVGKWQVLTIVLCGLVAMIDGFDTQSIAFVAPVIAREWGLDVSAFGPVFGIGLFGLTLGALILGPLADRFGRKPIILVSVLIFGLGALASAWAHDLNTLMAFRLLTGFGLGAAIPNLIALTAEYAPKRVRTLVVTAMFCGFPIGAVLGGLVSARIIPAFGWQSVFIAGGVLPILLLPVLAVLLPESIRFCLATGKAERAAALARRVDKQAVLTIGTPATGLVRRGGLRSVLADGRAAGTLLIWSAFFCNLLILYFLINWLPSVLEQAGLPLDRAIVATVLLNAGGVMGGLAFSPLIDRFGPRFVLTLAYLLAGVFVAVIGAGWTSTVVILGIVFWAGFFVIGAQFGMNALAAEYYPTAVRASGVGAAFGMGRIGSIVGPVVGGLLLEWRLPLDGLFGAAALPAAVAAISVYFACAPRRRGAEPASTRPITAA